MCNVGSRVKNSKERSIPMILSKRRLEDLTHEVNNMLDPMVIQFGLHREKDGGWIVKRQTLLNHSGTVVCGPVNARQIYQWLKGCQQGVLAAAKLGKDNPMFKILMEKVINF